MAIHPERMAILMARCSDGAREYLRDLQRHERFAELVARLEGLEGTIYQLDVEKHFLELVRK